MKRILLLLFIPLALAPAGYFIGLSQTEEIPQEEIHEPETQSVQELLFKMPLGGLTTQIMQSTRIIHIVMDVDVYLASASEFEKLNGAEGRALLRDATITALSDMAETTLWLKDEDKDAVTNEALASQITFNLIRKFNTVRGTRVNKLIVAFTKRL